VSKDDRVANLKAIAALRKGQIEEPAVATDGPQDVVQAKHEVASVPKPEGVIAAKKLSKNADPNYLRTTLYLHKDNHSRLKLTCIKQRLEMSEVVDFLVKQWLDNLET
jgi:hypothetical protein